MYSNVTGIILAGGKSSRMGQNKSLLEIGNITVIERLIQLMNSIFKDVILITNTPEEFEFLDIPMYKDIYEYKGPLAGIHSALANSTTEENFIISCDLPLITKEIIEFIIDYKTDKAITVCNADGFIQQLAGKYSRSILTKTEELLVDGITSTSENKQYKRKSSVYNLIYKVGAEIIDVENINFYKEGTFYNMNRPKDYEFIIENLDKKKYW